MILSTNPASSDIAADVLRHVSDKGVRLWVEDGQLRYRALKGALTAEDIRALQQSKNELVATLKRAASPSHLPTADPRFVAPLTYSQVAHWNTYRLNERPSVRQIASATTLRGRLVVAALEAAFMEIIRRHDALRTRIVLRNGVPMQQISTISDFRLRQVDLRAVSGEQRLPKMKKLISNEIMAPVDVCRDPLFTAALVGLAEDEHVLIIAMEHLISDAVSMNLLLRDLTTAYHQLLQSEPVVLPDLPVQFAEYARWQEGQRGTWMVTHGPYWTNHLQGLGRMRFPSDKDATPAQVGWGTTPLLIDRQLKGALLDWCRVRKTTLVMAVFTAFAILTLRWCKVSQGILQYQSDGRFNPKLENSIGYYASPLYLKVELRNTDTFLDAIHRVTAEYIRAHQHADFGLMESGVARPDLTRNSCFNWVPGDTLTTLGTAFRGTEAIVCEPFAFEHPMLQTLERDTEPVVLLYNGPEDVAGGVCFPLARFSTVTMEEFGREMIELLRAVLPRAEAPLSRLWVEEEKE